MTEETEESKRARYAMHDLIWSLRDNLHSPIYWEDAQMIGNAVYANLQAALAKPIPEVDASIDEAFELGKVVGYREATLEISGSGPLPARQTLWHKDQFYVTFDIDSNGEVTISEELLLKLLTESGWNKL